MIIFVIIQQNFHLYLQMTELSHSVISPLSFRLEYKRGSTGPTMFQRYVRIQVDINPICKQGDVADLLFAITFTLLSGELCKLLKLNCAHSKHASVGNIRRFRRICEHIQAQVCSKRYPSSMHGQDAQKSVILQQQSSQTSLQPMCTSSNSGAASAESISCGSADSSDRLSYRERQNDTESEVETYFDCNTTITKPRRSSASSNKSKNSDDGQSPCTPSIKSVSSR